MGGYAHLIPVEPDEGLLEESRNPRRSWLSRLFGKPTRPSERARLHSPASALGGQMVFMEQRNDGGFVELPVSKKLRRSLMGDFLSFAKNEIPEQWVATQEFCKTYLLGIKPKLYLRGQQDKADEPFYYYVQLSFSDCAGMAGPSSALAAHWAKIWYQKRRELIEGDYLRPHQLTPVENLKLDCEQEHTFIPAGEYGYACYYSDQQLAKLYEPEERPCHFDVDACWREGLYSQSNDDSDGAMPMMDVEQFLEKGYAGLMSDGQCRCQLCMPEFDASELDQFKIQSGF